MLKSDPISSGCGAGQIQSVPGNKLLAGTERQRLYHHCPDRGVKVSGGEGQKRGIVWAK